MPNILVNVNLSDTPALIAVGETMVLVTPADATPLADADGVRLSIGGAESNVAAHVAALGQTTAWVGALGDEVLGHRTCRAIAALGVDTRWVRFDPDAPTGVYFKNPGHGVLYYRAGSAASRMTAASIAAVPLEEATIVHISGITPSLSPQCAAMIANVVARVAESDAMLSFDVNYRAALWPVATAAPALLDLANRADIVFVGLDEAETLWGPTTPEEVRALIAAPARLIVKNGDVGATEFSDAGTVFAPAIATDVVEAVGAGDAFAAGYLAGLLAAERPMERLRGGHRRAHLVLQSTDDVIGVSAIDAASNPRPTKEG